MKLFLVLLIFVTVLVGWTVPTTVYEELPPIPVHDARVGQIHQLFIKYNVEPHYEKVYLKEADEHGVDWKLLPAIAIIESQAGRYSRGNNHWGWNSGHTKFDSVEQGIGFVTEKLATSRYYRGKTTSQILMAYGPGTQEYVNIVLGLMKKLDEAN